MKPAAVEHYYRASCLGKRPLIQSKAWRTAAHMTVQYGERYVAYECRFCGEWHVGHETRKDRERRERKDVQHLRDDEASG